MSLAKPTIHEIVLNRYHEQADVTAFKFYNAQTDTLDIYTYGDLVSQALSIAAALKPYEVAKRPVAIALKPGPSYIAAILGTLYAGAIFVPLAPPKGSLDHGRAKNILKESDAALALIDSNPKAEWSSFESPCSLIHIEELAASKKEELTPPTVHANTLCFLQYSSGTTRQPKGIKISYGNLMSCLHLMASTLALTPNERGCSWLPPYHDMGLVGAIFLPLFIGFPMVYMTPHDFAASPLKWLELMSQEQSTITAAPNFAYDWCVDRFNNKTSTPLDLSALRVAINGAEMVHSRTLRRFSTTFGSHGFRHEAFYPAYGLAEATLMVACSKPSEWHPLVQTFKRSLIETGKVEECYITQPDSIELVSCGKPLEALEVRIVDREDHTLRPQGYIGEIWVKGPTVAKGYWNHEEGTEQAFHNNIVNTDMRGFLRTGDTGFLDSEGHLFLTGRIRDLIIIHGRTLIAEDIEDCVKETLELDTSYHAAAFSNRQNYSEHLILMQEVPSIQAAEEYKTKILSALQTRFSLIPDRIIFLKKGSLPLTPSGKIKRHVCSVLYQLDLVDTLMEVLKSDVVGEEPV